MATSQEFTVQEAAKIVGTTERNVRFWSGPAGIVTAEISNPQIQRSPKLFSRRNLLELRIVTVLAQRGIGLDHIRRALTSLAEKIDQHPSIIERLLKKPETQSLLAWNSLKTWRLTAWDEDSEKAGENIIAAQNVYREIVRSEVTIVVNIGLLARRILARG